MTSRNSTHISDVCSPSWRRFSSIIVGALLCLTFLTSAQASDRIPERISFQNLLENKDIALGEGGAIFQDSEGFMWFGGSNALIRYNGYEFREIKYDNPKDPTADQESVKYVQHINEDSDRILWVSTRTGLYRYDPVIDKLTQVKDDANNPIKITAIDLMDSQELPSGELLVASVSGLVIVNRETLAYEVITPSEDTPNGMHGHRVNTVLHNPRTKELWLGTEVGLEKVDWNNKHFTLHLPHPSEPDNAAANWIMDIALDEDDTLWLGTSVGLVHYDPKTEKRVRYINDPDNHFSLSGNDIWKLEFDKTGALWIASDGGGVSVFDRTNNRFINHMTAAGRPGALNSNQVRTVFEDRTGDMWVGNYPVGINFFDRSSAAITSYAKEASNPNSLSHSSVLSVREDSEGNLWLGTDGGGLNYFNRDNGTFKSYQHIPNDPHSISSNAVLCVYIDSKGMIWTGHWAGGITRFDPKTEKFTRYPYDEQRAIDQAITKSKRLNSAHVWSIREDKNGDMWLTTHTGGMSKLDRKTDEFTHYMPIANDPDSIVTLVGWGTYIDSHDRFWVLTSGGLDLLDRETGKFTHFLHDPDDPTSLSNPSVLSAYEDSKGRLWFGTDAGLNLLNIETKTFIAYGKRDGFNDDAIRSILEDENGNLWLSTNNGISVFNPEDKSVKNYNRESGKLVGGFHTDSGIISSRGEVIFGGVTGLRLYKPAEMTGNKNIPPVVLTDFKIFADSISVGGEDGLLTKSINQTDQIELDYKKSMFIFEFAALNYRDTSKNQYSYKLEGFDDNWLNVGTQRQAKYTNLNAGKYTFKVRGSNNDGVWNEEGKLITIVQFPPPWKTWWAYTLYGLAILAALALFVQHQRKKRQLIEEQNRILEMKVSERTAQLREKNNDIQAMLSNMPQGLFTVQEGGTIHPEYSKYLETIFETEDISGREANELLFNNAHIGSDALDSTKNAVFAIIGEDEMNFDFNSCLLIDEYKIDIKDQQKILSLDWNPILVDDIVQKLMVSVRDVTVLRQMESEAEEQKRQMEIISQLLNLPSDKYLSFESSAKKYLASNREAIENCSEKDDNIIALLFRNMHTIKGNCRTLSFTHLSNTVHEVESTYSDLKNNPESNWDQGALLSELDDVEAAVDEYANIFHEVLGRSDSGRRSEGFWMESRVMTRIQSYVDDNNIDKLRTFLAQLHAKPLTSTLSDIVDSLNSIAMQLDKEPPKVEINAKGILIQHWGLDLIKAIFAHILRNSIDHGIELPEERKQKGKDTHGLITINTSTNDGKLIIQVVDDGKGLDMEHLFSKGVELNIWPSDSSPSREDIANLMFTSGVTTKNCITDISGRGVGMDAVKVMLKEQGGDAYIQLHPEMAESDEYTPFELILELPANSFFYNPDE